MRSEVYDLTYAVEDDHWWYAARRHIVVERVRAALGACARPEPRILDVGCGTGAMLREWRRIGAAYGIDASERAVAYCRMRGIADVAQIDPEAPLPHEPPFGAEPYSLISALDVLEHVPDDAALVSAVARWLRPGGFLVITVPAYGILWSGEDEVSHHLRRYTRRQLVAGVRRVGFEIVEATYFNLFLLPAQAAWALWWRAAGRRVISSVRATPDWLNGTLRSIMAAEARLLRRFALPAGGSILCIARKPVRD